MPCLRYRNEIPSQIADNSCKASRRFCRTLSQAGQERPLVLVVEQQTFRVEETDMPNERFAVVTGASTGIGLELARCCARAGFDLLIAADEPAIETAAGELRGHGGQVDALQADLSTTDGVDRLYAATSGRPVDALLANAGVGLGRAFLDQDFNRVRRVIDTNITGTAYLIHRVGNDMRRRGDGRILITGSIAGFMPGSFQAVYNGSKAFPGFILVCAARGVARHRRHRHLPDARRHRDRILQARRHDGYQRRHGQEG
jgi:short chain dehydrogenase